MAYRFPRPYYAQLAADYQARRDRFCQALWEIGFEFEPPEGAYYIMAGDHRRSASPTTWNSAATWSARSASPPCPARASSRTRRWGVRMFASASASAIPRSTLPPSGCGSCGSSSETEPTRWSPEEGIGHEDSISPRRFSIRPRAASAAACAAASLFRGPRVALAIGPEPLASAQSTAGPYSNYNSNQYPGPIYYNPGYAQYGLPGVGVSPWNPIIQAQLNLGMRTARYNMYSAWADQSNAAANLYYQQAEAQADAMNDRPQAMQSALRRATRGAPAGRPAPTRRPQAAGQERCAQG